MVYHCTLRPYAPLGVKKVREGNTTRKRCITSDYIKLVELESRTIHVMAMSRAFRAR